jgi:hypothetical protein
MLVKREGGHQKATNRNAEFPMTEERKFILLCWKNAYTFQEKSNIFFASLLLNQFAN